MEWRREGEVLPPAPAGGPDTLRAWRPWVLGEDDGTLRMWYTGHDGSTGRILEAVKPPGRPWRRLGVALEVGSAGGTDAFGVESPCVVKVRGGYLMAYGGSDGESTRLHMAVSADGHRFESQGTIMQREKEDALAATHPCLVVTGERWWLFYSGYDGSNQGRRAAVLAAVSDSGASWDRLGSVLEPQAGELAATQPCVLDASLGLQMFYASDDGERVSVAVATSEDGIGWERRGITLAPSAGGPDALGAFTPCVVKSRDGSLRMWYAGRPTGDTTLAYRILTAAFPGP
jgi:predicted GH43/DUF377 family glycosyl hydrolase